MSLTPKTPGTLTLNVKTAGTFSLVPSRTLLPDIALKPSSGSSLVKFHVNTL